MLLVAAQILPNVDTIEQKFLEPGHTQMEVDSMHAAIDHHKKNLKVSSPNEWPILLHSARREAPPCFI